MAAQRAGLQVQPAREQLRAPSLPWSIRDLAPAGCGARLQGRGSAGRAAAPPGNDLGGGFPCALWLACRNGDLRGCTENSGTARQGHALLSAAGRVKPCQRLPLCGNKGDNIHSVKSNETENGFNPFIITAQSPMPQMASDDGAGTKPGCSPRAACGMDTGSVVPAPFRAHHGVGDLLRCHRPEQIPCSGPDVGWLWLWQQNT